MANEKDYIDKKEFYDEMKKFKEAYDAAPDGEKPKPNAYICECIIKLAYNMAKSHRFSGYTFKEEMIGDGIENCIRYIHNFDPENAKKNPFGYFSLMMHRAFVRRLKSENSYNNNKMAIFALSGVDDLINSEESDNVPAEFIEDMRDFILHDKHVNLDRTKKQRTSKKSAGPSLADHMGDDEE